jgi:hypothetical protein
VLLCVRAAANGSRISKSSILIIQLDIYILLCTAQQHIGQLKDSGRMYELLPIIIKL